MFIRGKDKQTGYTTHLAEAEMFRNGTDSENTIKEWKEAEKLRFDSSIFFAFLDKCSYC